MRMIFILNAYRFHIFSGFHVRLHFSKSKTRVVSISIFKAEYGITMHTNSHNNLQQNVFII